MGCQPDNVYVGIGDDAMCCSGVANAIGYCVSASTGSASATSSTGGTTGPTYVFTGPGPCPKNIPDIATGQTQQTPQACAVTAPCPQGFSCISGKCLLNGVDAGLQITLSWDLPEDLDLHVIEPKADGGPGGCGIWYQNTNRPPGQGDTYCRPVGTLDRDSNPGCALDNIDIENVIYPPGRTPPPGTYMAIADFYEDCAGKAFWHNAEVEEYAQVPYAMQVRLGDTITVYCNYFTGGTADEGSKPEAGNIVSVFTVP